MLLTCGRNCDLNKFLGSHLRQALVFMWSGGRRSISIFYKFLLVLVKIFVLGGGQGTMLKFYEVLKFSCFLIPKTESLRLFSKSSGNLYISCLLLITRFVSLVVKGKFGQTSKSLKIS